MSSTIIVRCNSALNVDDELLKQRHERKKLISIVIDEAKIWILHVSYYQTSKINYFCQFMIKMYSVEPWSMTFCATRLLMSVKAYSEKVATWAVRYETSKVGTTKRKIRQSFQSLVEEQINICKLKQNDLRYCAILSCPVHPQKPNFSPERPISLIFSVNMYLTVDSLQQKFEHKILSFHELVEH